MAVAPTHRTDTSKAQAPAPQSRAARGLKDLLDNRKRPSLLLADIRAHVAAEALRPDPARRADVLHPSEVCKPEWCPRAAARQLRGVAPKEPETHGFQLEAIFQYGHDAHARWQRWMAEMRLLEGTWHCLNCRNDFYARGALVCDCGCDALVYQELRLHSAPLLMEGYTDGYVPDRQALVEIKTVGEGTVRMYDPVLHARHRLATERGEITDVKGLWDAIHRPLLPHLRQGQVYLHLARGMGLDAQRIVFLYDSKLTQAAKEFAVSYDASLIQPILEGAAAVKAHVQDGGPEPACRFPGACKQCAGQQ